MSALVHHFIPSYVIPTPIFQFSDTDWVPNNLIQCDIIYPELAQTPEGKGSVPLQTPAANEVPRRPSLLPSRL